MKEMIVNNKITYHDKVHDAFDVLHNYHIYGILVRALFFHSGLFLPTTNKLLLIAHHSYDNIPRVLQFYLLHTHSQKISPLVHQALHLP